MEPNPKEPRTSILQLVKQMSTEQIFVQQVYSGRVPRAPQIFIVSVLFTALSVFIALQIMPEHAIIISVFLSVLGIMPTFSLLIRREQSAALVPGSQWYGRFKYGAQLRLALGVLAMFAAVMLVYAAFALSLPGPDLQSYFGIHIKPYLAMRAPDYRPEHFESIFMNNLMVASSVFILATLYRAGGALLVLVWNGSLWGSVFAFFARAQSQPDTMGGPLAGFAKLMAAVLPHTMLEALAYVVTALAGLVVPRLLIKEQSNSQQTWETVRGMLVLLVVALILVRVSAAIEVTLAPRVLEMLNL